MQHQLVSSTLVVITGLTDVTGVFSQLPQGLIPRVTHELLTESGIGGTLVIIDGHVYMNFRTTVVIPQDVCILFKPRLHPLMACEPVTPKEVTEIQVITTINHKRVDPC